MGGGFEIDDAKNFGHFKLRLNSAPNRFTLYDSNSLVMTVSNSVYNWDTNISSYISVRAPFYMSIHCKLTSVHERNQSCADARCREGRYVFPHTQENPDRTWKLEARQSWTQYRW